MLPIAVAGLVTVGVFFGLHARGLARKHPLAYLGAFVVYLAVMKGLELVLDGLDRTWGNGARGEERVGQHLVELQARGWTVLHDVVLDGWNIDHVAVGPTGVFTIETKSHRGRIGFDGKQLVRGGKPLEKDFLRQAKSQALWLAKQLGEKGHDLFVVPIVCFTRGYVQVSKAATRPVVVVPLKWLPEALERGKGRLDDANLDAVADAVREICLGGHGGLAANGVLTASDATVALSEQTAVGIND